VTDRMSKRSQQNNENEVSGGGFNPDMSDHTRTTNTANRESKTSRKDDKAERQKKQIFDRD